MKIRTLKAFILAAATAVILAGCATGQGGMGSGAQSSAGGGPNGVVSPANPFGFGTGPGMSH